MDGNKLIRIIKETIEEFDFLANESALKEQEIIDLLKNEDLQKQFICDSLLERKDKIKILNNETARLGGNWEDDPENANILTVEYDLKVQYTYDKTKEPLIMGLYFYGDAVRINVSSEYDRGSYMTPPEGESWFNSIEWNDIKVQLLTEDGDDIRFIAFEKAPFNIKKIFIREYVEQFISSYTNMNVHDTIDKSQITQFC